MTKKAWGVLLGIVAFIGIAGSVWGVSSYWHSYCATETIHEVSQDEDIDLAMSQSRLALAQQRMKWLEMRIWEMGKEYGCPNCTGPLKKIYDEYLTEYKELQQEVSSLIQK